MTYAHNAVAHAGVKVRATFITRTYLHLFGAILAFIAIEIALFQSGLAYDISRLMFQHAWLLFLGGFIIVSWIATHVARHSKSLPAQYIALAVYVAAEALIFVPLLFVAEHYAPGTIKSAAFVTLSGFTALTFLVVWTRQDFSFMGAILQWGFIIALLLIIASAIFGFKLGILFSVAMIALAGGAIMYDTSNVMHYYPPDRYVSAALQLFSSVALMFWYVLQFMLFSRD